MKPYQRLLVISIAALGIAGCPGDDSPPVTDTDTDSDTSTTGTTDDTCGTACMGDDEDSTSTTDAVDTTAANESTTGSGDEDECQASSECAREFCVAPFDPELGVFGKGPFACVAECVPGEEDPMYELLWCADADACCNPDAECTDRGYCEVPGADSTGDDTTDGMDTTDGDDTTGGDTEGTTGDTSTGGTTR